ncbi:hypothetical protein BD309DRAFT_959409 [Dichomitus squalens]|uniref:Uncharacterized protein n=1 Tax=Dichomitus squalens TaxID=114155 RepID=A0A4Q9MKG4_9APHY|nr:hypothetical protein BD311DRAFT_760752 [Dichomitus squalens]TBU44009.1 hypothetical protein BD309DRAFT_959409 [Dichomitus squalens]
MWRASVKSSLGTSIRTMTALYYAPAWYIPTLSNCSAATFDVERWRCAGMTLWMVIFE